MLESFCKFLAKQCTDFQRFQIVRIIVAGREYIVPQHDAALDFFAEALASGFDIHIDDVFARCAETVAYAVIAGQVRAGFCRRDDVVHRDAAIDMRNGNVYDFSAFGFIEFQSGFDGCFGFFFDAFAEEFLRYAYLHALHVADESLLVVLLFLRNGSGIFRVMAGDRIENDSRVGDILYQRSDLVQRGGECQKAVTGNEAISRFQTYDAIERRRLTDGSAGVGTQRPDGFGSCDCCCRAAGRAAGDIVGIPGISRRAESGTLRGGTHGKFIHVGLAQGNIIFCLQFFDDSSIIGGYPVFQHLRSGGASLAFDAHIVFDSARNAGQVRDFFPRSNLGIYLCGYSESRFIRSGEVRMNVPFHTIAMSDDFLRQFDSGDFLLHQLFMEIMNRVFHSAASLHNLRHFEIAVFFFRRIQQCFFVGKRLVWCIFAHDIVLLYRMYRRRYISRIVLVQFFHVSQNTIHGIAHLFQIAGLKLQAGKERNLLSFFSRNFHRYTSLNEIRDNRESLSIITQWNGIVSREIISRLTAIDLVISNQ